MINADCGFFPKELTDKQISGKIRNYLENFMKKNNENNTNMLNPYREKESLYKKAGIQNPEGLDIKENARILELVLE